MTAMMMTVTLSIPWAHSLKQKRMVVKSLTDRLKKRNLTVMESGRQDEHAMAEISMVALAAHRALADAIFEDTMGFIESECEAEVVNVVTEWLL